MVSKNGQPNSEDLRRNGVGEGSLARECNRRYSVKCHNKETGANGECGVRYSVTGVRGGHWWVIEGQMGPLSQGICKFCGTSKVFANSTGVDIKKTMEGAVGKKETE
jgi:hypothetical protein